MRERSGSVGGGGGSGGTHNTENGVRRHVLA